MADRPEHSAEDVHAGASQLVSPFVAIDACRPGSEDLARELPSELVGRIRRDDRLAARYSEVQRFDHTVAAAFAAVPIPTGLAERLNAAIAEQQAELEAERITAPVERAASVDRAAPQEASRRTQTSRRRWLQIAGGALTSMAAGGGIVWWRRSSDQPDLSLEDVLDRTLAFHQSSEAKLGEAVPVSRTAAPAEYPLSRLLVGLRNVVRWRTLDGRFLGRPGVAYELAGRDERSATLYVLAAEGRRGAPEIPSLPDQPLNPISTGGFTLAGWREADRIELLVVEGDGERYRSFLTHPRDIA